MSNKNIESVLNVLPDIIKNAGKYFVENLSENSKEIVDSASGTAGIILKLFAKPVVDKIYEKRTENRLANFGTATYFEAAQRQVTESLEKINLEIEEIHSAEDIIRIVSEITETNLDSLKPENLLVVFQPQYHPAIELVKNNQKHFFEKLNIKSTLIDDFIRDFNKNINQQVQDTFGDDYSKHIEEIKDYLLEEAEAKILVETIKNARIGFDVSEELEYEETFGQWLPFYFVNRTSEKEFDSSNKHNEKDLSPVTKLIEEHFNNGDETCIDKILFIVADFGKGKSVFMKQYAAKLARNYLQTNEGYFPIYFNLREYNEYKSDEKLGVIANFLCKKYSFDIEQNKSRKFIFLVDSLDESGELNQLNIDSVINSIKKVQGLDSIHCRKNRIIITSRPIDGALNSHLERHSPCIRKNSEGRDIAHFISLYGFKKEQFNNWIINALAKYNRVLNDADNEFVRNILKNIYKNNKFDVYKELLKDKTLTPDELQRPIFAYMIYQLIIKNIDFLKVGKIGIYLSFINLLSKDAKYINDRNLTINLNKEFEFRNLLNATAALWQLERHKSNQGFLKKADICRVLDGENKKESDSNILSRYKEVSDVEFLSHSYFGKDNDTLHFQHQSFAEILLAEYYLKVFIRYALEIEPDIYKCREKLILGNPTYQTKRFLESLLILLRETVTDEVNADILEKRKLLFPLFASLSTQKNNILFCTELYYTWFNRVSIKTNEIEYPKELLHNWCITKERLEKIVELSAEIFNSNDTYVLSQAEPRVNLFNSELMLIRNYSTVNLKNYLDKGFALLVGNYLSNDFTNIEKPILFNTKYKINVYTAFELLNSKESYDWDNLDLFQGLDMRELKNRETIEIYSGIFDLNLSYSYLDNIYFSQIVGDVDFNYSTLNNVDFYGGINGISFYKSKLHNCSFLGEIFDVDFSQTSEYYRLHFDCMYNGLYIHSLNYFDRNSQKHIDKYGKLFISQKLCYNIKKNKSLINIKGNKFKIKRLEQIVSFIRTFAKTTIENRSKSKRDGFKELFLFQDDRTKDIFFKSLFENKTISEAFDELNNK